MSLADEFNAIPTGEKAVPEPRAVKMPSKAKSLAAEFESIPTEGQAATTGGAPPGYRPGIPPDNWPSGKPYYEKIQTGTPEETDTWADKIRAGIEAAGGTVSTAVASIPGIPYGVFNHVIKSAHNAAFPNAKYPSSTGEEDIISGIRSFTPDVAMPKTELAQKYMEDIGAALQAVPVLGGEGAAIGAGANVAAQFAKARVGVALAGKEPISITPLTITSKAHGTSPELHAEIAKHEAAGTINPIVARRHIDADSLPEVIDEYGNPLKVRLTKGMATQDSAILSEEKNTRSTNDAVRQIMDENGRAMPLVLDKFKEQVAPDISFRNTPEEGQFYIDKLDEVRQKLHDKTRADYEELHNAAEASGLTNTPLDAQAFAQDVSNRFKQQGLYHEDLPQSVRMRVEKIASGEEPLDFKKFEQLRTQLGREQRKAASSTAEGSASSAYAIGEVRDALENLQLTQEAQSLKPLADKARASAKLDFDLQKRSPAYKAVVEGTARPDDFADKYILGNNKNTGVNAVQNLLNMFPDDKQFHQALAYSTLNDIKNQAVNSKGQIMSAKLDKAIKTGEDSGKHDLLLPIAIRDGLEKLNKTAQLVQGAPAGNYIQGNPNLAAYMGHYINSGAYKVATSIPGVGQLANVFMGMRQTAKQRQFATESTKPGAGLDYPVRK